MIADALSDNEISYYATIAQLLPVLMIAVALQFRYSDWVKPIPAKWARTALRWVVFAGFVCLFSGELMALGALYDDDASDWDYTITILAVLFSLISIYLGGLSFAVRDIGRLKPAEDEEADDNDD